MEIGSFIELGFNTGQEYYAGKNVVRLNTGRAAIYHSFLSTGCSELYLPVYQCHSVESFLLSKGVTVKYYNIDENFEPVLSSIPDSAAVLVVNYFGIFSESSMRKRVSKYPHVIIDNCPAFYSKPIENAYNVYSARKFFGVPDGSYAIGPGILPAVSYDEDFSSDTSAYLLKRIEYGCAGKVYAEREQNESRLDCADILRMSKLTHTILDGINYGEIAEKRRRNFEYARQLFDQINEINVGRYYDSSTIPMVYPLLSDDPSLFQRLLDGQHYQGNWWKYILNRSDANSFEKRLSRYMVPITIDQRYGEKELDYIKSIVYGK